MDNKKKKLKKKAPIIVSKKKKLKKRKPIKFFIMTYTANVPFAKKTQKVLKDTYGINSEIVVGEKISKEVKFNHILYHNFYKYLLPKMLEYGGRCYYLEDDVRFTSNPLENIPTGIDVYWSVYRKGGKKPTKYVVGSQAILFNNKALKLLETQTKFRKAHIDGFFTKFLNYEEGRGNLKWETAIPKIGYEQEHDSLITTDPKQRKKFEKPN